MGSTEIITPPTTPRGYFFCHACLMDKPDAEKSPDHRYCQSCFDFLKHEAELLQPGKYPRWVPQVGGVVVNSPPGRFLGQQDGDRQVSRGVAKLNRPPDTQRGRHLIFDTERPEVTAILKNYSLGCRAAAKKLGVSPSTVARARVRLRYEVRGR